MEEKECPWTQMLQEAAERRAASALKGSEQEFVGAESLIREEEGRVQHLLITEIAPNPAQPRRCFSPEALRRLSESIRIYGVLQPLTVRRLGEAPPAPGLHCCGGAHYLLIAGERRLRAAALAGLTRVPCLVMTTDDRTAAQLALIENIHREDLNMFEQAAAMASLIDLHGLTQEQLAERLSSSQSAVANKLRLLRLTEPERQRILEGLLTERHARTLLRLQDVSLRQQALEQVIRAGMNVAATEAYVEKLLAVSQQKKRQRQVRCKMVRGDLRLFYNTIDHAVTLMQNHGVPVLSKRRVQDGWTEIVLRIPSDSEPPSSSFSSSAWGEPEPSKSESV